MTIEIRIAGDPPAPVEDEAVALMREIAGMAGCRSVPNRREDVARHERVLSLPVDVVETARPVDRPRLEALVDALRARLAGAHAAATLTVPDAPPIALATASTDEVVGLLHGLDRH